MVTVPSTPGGERGPVPARVLFHPFFYLPESWNGIDEHLLHLARHLDPQEFELIVGIGPDDGSQTATLAKRAGLASVQLPSNVSSMRTRAATLRDVYRRSGADIVHMHSPTVGGQAPAALAARRAGSRAILTIHQYQPWSMPLRTRLVNRLTQRLFLDGVIAVSADVRLSAAERTGLRASVIEVVPNGIDGPAAAPELRKRGRPVVVGYFGRLSHEKGVDILVEALHLVRQAGVDVSAIIVGDGPERTALMALSDRAGVSESLEFRGFVPGARELMADVDIVVHTPRYEGFGLVALEAMAAGKPMVVAPAPGGLGEIVRDGETGLVAENASPAAVAAAIQRLAADSGLRRRMGIAAHQRWKERFSAVQMARRTADVYRDVLGSRTATQHRAGRFARHDTGPTGEPQPVNAPGISSEAGATTPRRNM
jgi:glycosyltransferase involved in cell wall biosynthesis